MKKRVAINGFGRIGRAAARILMEHGDVLGLELVALNDPSKPEYTAHFFQFDTNYGRYKGEVSIENNGEILNVDGKKIRKFTTRNLEDLTWGDLNIDVVLECTGAFKTSETAGLHLKQGAKKVVISAPAKSEDIPTFVMGVNDEKLTGKETILSNASCTTNCLAPVAKALNDAFGIEKGLMTTIHAYTSTQNILDGSHKDLRRGRAGAENMLPASTGAAIATALVLPELKGKLNGMSVRVPTPTVSLVDLVVEVKKKVTVEEVNAALEKASSEKPHILGFEKRPLVSNDFKGDSRASIIDASETMVIEGNMIKVLSWYDNEWGYTNRLLELAAKC